MHAALQMQVTTSDGLKAIASLVFIFYVVGLLLLVSYRIYERSFSRLSKYATKELQDQSLNQQYCGY